MTHEVGGYVANREQRRRGQLFTMVPFLLLMTVALSLKTSVVFAVGLLGVLILLSVGGQFAASIRGRVKEGRRRQSGNPPSWPALVPMWAIRATDPSVGRLRDGGELFGRLVMRQHELYWVPSRRSVQQFSVPELHWDRSWDAHVDPVWGIGQQGHLSLTNRDGRQVDIWVRNVKDLRSVLGAS